MSVSLRGRGARAALALVVLAALAAAAAFSGQLAGGSGEARAAGPQDRVRDVVFAIHGGAGTIRRSDLTPDQERAYRAALTTALEAGRDVLRGGGEATDAVKAAIVTMEDSELFNAGKGAVFTTDAGQELDASIMDGDSLDTGAVTGVEHIRNPILLADAVRTGSRHVMFAGHGAELFAQHKGFELVTQEYFHTDRRFQSLLNAKRGEPEFEFGTVGAVALDRQGDLAAGTSTGGLTNKPVGRIGDSPIIGAGTYANNATAAVSATGTGEFFIRQVVGHEISAAMEYGGMNVERAARRGIEKVEQLGGDGGVIALDGRGTLATPFNTEGMYRGYVTGDGQLVTKIYGDE
jgi:beta-aspartyl-peptidase (threonine type)